MSTDIAGFGTIVTLVASTTFPTALPISQFADDADSLDTPGIEIAQVAMGMNGNLVSWPHAVPIPVTISVIPNSDDDKNLQALADANRVGANKNSANDIITINVVYPSGKQISFKSGKLTNAPTGLSIAANGRLKTNTYSFMFESKA